MSEDIPNAEKPAEEKKAEEKPAKDVKPAEKPVKEAANEERIAVIRVRGRIRIKNDVSATLEMLKLYNNNFCTIIPGNASYLGMLRKVKDYVTWGVIDAETEKLLIEKRGEKVKEGERTFFRLSPPKKGFGRKGVKQPFSLGGALGNRKEKINDLIKRML